MWALKRNVPAKSPSGPVRATNNIRTPELNEAMRQPSRGSLAAESGLRGPTKTR